MSDGDISLKRCTKCGKEKSATTDFFEPDTRYKSGFRSACRLCRNNSNTEWRKKNAEYNRARMRKYHQEHKEESHRKNKEWREKNREYDRQRHKIYAQNNREKRCQYLISNRKRTAQRQRERYQRIIESERIRNRIKATRYYRTHPEEAREKQRRYRLIHPRPKKPFRTPRAKSPFKAIKATQLKFPFKYRSPYDKEKSSARFKAYYARRKEYNNQRVREWQRNNPRKHAASAAKRRTLKTGAGGKYTEWEWQKLCMKYDHRCLCCDKREPDIKLTADHIIPIIKGGSSHIENIQPLCKSCNSSKGRKVIDFRPKTLDN